MNENEEPGPPPIVLPPRRPPVTPITEAEEARRRREAEETARRVGGAWSAAAGRRGSTGRIPPAAVTLGTLLLFLVLGRFLWGWGHAAGLTALVLLHECGHVWAARRKGLPVTGLVFLPFVGAYVTTLRHGRDRETDAFVALMGPVFGAAGGVACLALAAVTRQPLFLDLAVWGFGLNLINLLPLAPLDGSAIAPVLVARTRTSRYDRRPGAVSSTAKTWLSVGYLGLALLLALGTYALPIHPFFHR